MAVEQIEIGRYVYLFKSSTDSVNCVISAHGGYIFENRSFTVPNGVALKFFANHGNAAMDAGMSTFLNKLAGAQPVETLVANQVCKNYLLTKYQGRHGEENETYATIMRDVDGIDTARQKWMDRIDKAKQEGGKEATLNSYLLSLAKISGASVITIRNRFNVLTGIPLADVIRDVRRVEPTISNFYCSFCRANSLPFVRYGKDYVKFNPV